MSKPHVITVTIASESEGELNQEVLLREYASTAEELVYKNHAIADAVVDSLQKRMKELSANYLQGKQPK